MNAVKRILNPYDLISRHALLVTAMIAVSLLFVFNLLQYCHFGIDLTDEGFYLNWIANPRLYAASHTQFGFIYHPLYQLMGEDIVRLRQADILIMLGLAWILCIELFYYVFKEELLTHTPYTLYGLTFALATTVFSFFGAWWWIPTPSYNSLTLEALLITSIGLIQLSRGKNPIRGAIILGVGLWLAIMAKPTSAILLGFLSMIYIMLTSFKTLTPRHLYLPGLITVSLLFLSAWGIDGSILKFITRLQQGAYNMSLLYEGHSFEFWPQYIGLLPDHPSQLIFILLTISAFFITAISTPATRRIQLFFFLILFALSTLICLHYYNIPYIAVPATNIMIAAIPLGASLALLMVSNTSKTHHTTGYIILALFFMLLPYTFALGTRGNVWTTAMRMGLFWILAAIPLIQRVNTPHFLPLRAIMTLIIGGQLLTIILVQLSIQHPYRQPQALLTQTKSFEIINPKGRVISHLTIADEDWHYLEQLKQTAHLHGFSYGDAMIDLTGAFPTVLYLLGAKAIGAPWLIAGFGGSTDYAVAILSQTSCTELASAWVLTSLNGIEKYDPSVLIPHGLSKEAYDVINETVLARFNLQHQLMKPKRSELKSVKICEKARIKQKNADKIVKQTLKNELPFARNIIVISNRLLDQHQIDQAISLLENAISINPSNPIFFNNLCFAYGIQKKFSLAEKACLKALALEPQLQLAKNNLNWILSEKSASN
jgi:hypothetical protein